MSPLALVIGAVSFVIVVTWITQRGADALAQWTRFAAMRRADRALARELESEWRTVQREAAAESDRMERQIYDAICRGRVVPFDNKRAS